MRIAFTRPYLDTGGSIIARKDAGIKTMQELNNPKFTYAILNVPPAIARAKQVLPNVTQLLLDSPSALFLAVKTGRATAFAIDKPIADYYEAGEPRPGAAGHHRDAVRLRQQDSIFLKPGDFKWWLFLDTWVGELRSGSRYDQYVAWYRKWLKKDPPPQRFYDLQQILKRGLACRSTCISSSRLIPALLRGRRGHGRTGGADDRDLPGLGPAGRAGAGRARAAGLDRRRLYPDRCATRRC